MNFSNVDLVCLQHEYGIFGGPAGSHILRLLRRLKMPIVTTLHTVLREPDANQRIVMDEIAALSDRLIVMSEHSSQLLQEVFGVHEEKIDVIPHGVPDLPFGDPNYYKDSSGTEGKAVLLTFGLLSPNKGIERVIEALPRIVADHPGGGLRDCGRDPSPRPGSREGDKYRLQLQSRWREHLGVERNVIFHNRFVSPGRDGPVRLARLTSTSPLIPTRRKPSRAPWPMRWARERRSFQPRTGTPLNCWRMGAASALPRSRTPDAIAAAAIELLDNEAARQAMRRARLPLCPRDTVWSEAAESYMSTFVRARTDRMLTPRIAFSDLNAENAGQAACDQALSSPSDDRQDRSFAARRVFRPELRRRLRDR